MSFNEFLSGPERFEVASAAMFSAPSRPIFVEVGASAVEANITREGVHVPNLAIDPAVLVGLLETLPTAPRLKVVRQSVEAGRAVERGTIVNLVFAEPRDLPVNIVGGVLDNLAGLKIGQVYGDFVAAEPEIKKILTTRKQATELTATEKQTIATVLGQGGVDVDVADDASVAGAFTGLQAANLFGSG